MNIRKESDYSTMFAALDAAVTAGLSQMEAVCRIDGIICKRPEKDAATAATKCLAEKSIQRCLASPRAMYTGRGISGGCMVIHQNRRRRQYS